MQIDEPSTPAISPWPQRIGMAVGIVLLAGAIVVVVMQREQVSAALEAVRRPSPVLIAVLLGSVAANLILSSLTFSLLMSRYAPRRVGIIEMQALIASTALVNFLPMRPGMFGRIAYHRAVNHIPVLDSVRVLIEGAVLTALAAAILAGLAALSHFAQWRIEPLILIPAMAMLLICVVPKATLRILTIAAFMRYTEVLIWSLRYLAAFALIGSPIETNAAIGFAAVSVLATMVPLLSNGLGLREWLVGLLAPIFAGYQLGLGLTAELINRAGEIIVVLVMGAVGMVVLARMRGSRVPPSPLSSMENDQSLSDSSPE